jgi:acyl-phosphate glycerol 3-phosphate acyltransferase
MSPPLLLGLTLLTSYLVGALPFGYLVARWRDVDIFRQGSGNIGATNIGRVLGRRFGILVFLLDFTKGALPVAAATWVGGHATGGVDPLLGRDGLPVAAGLAAFLGHLFPVYLRFHGGKGVATGAGVVAVLLPGPAAGAFLTWLTVLSATRTMSLASLSAVTALCALRLGLIPGPFAPEDRTLTVFCLVAAGLVALRHRSNIGRLLHGTENRLQDTPLMRLLAKTIHVLGLGLWFGSIVFFAIAALVIFHTFESLGTPNGERPAGLRLPADFDKDQGTRLAGVAVGPLFDFYYPLQGACGFLAVVTALGWSRAEPGRTVHRVRTVLLLLALAGVIAGWPLARHVADLRTARYASDPAVAEMARSEFGRWHGYSLLLNFTTLGFVTAGMALTAQLPNHGVAVKDHAGGMR